MTNTTIARWIGIFALLIYYSVAVAQDVNESFISLEGMWQFQTDPDDKGVAGKWFSHVLQETIKLPGSMVENGKGDDLTLTTNWTGTIFDSSWYFNPEMAKFRQPGNLKFPFWLTPNKYYVGAAWYQKKIEIPKSWKDKRMLLFIERPHWESRVWIDDKEIGMQNSLSTPHQYDVTNALTLGKHILTIRIDNRVKDINPGPDSHSITDHTQGNWNGMVGQLKLIAVSSIFVDDIRVFPEISSKTAKVEIVIRSNQPNTSGKIELYAESFNSLVNHKVQPSVSEFTVNATVDTLSIIYPMSDNVQLWDEFTPSLYNLVVKLRDNSGHSDVKKVVFGMREFKSSGTRFEVNGRPVFLRGTVENCVFPLTGYAPMDEASWTRVFRICREYGLNHMRFHSFCPPEAAFAAADKLGFYLQPEGPSWANHGSSLGDGKPIDKYLWEETERIVKTYGNHPSFCMFAYGNEPRGKYVRYLSKWLNYWKAKDNRRMYTGASIAMSWTVNPESEFIVRSSPRGIKWKEKPESYYDYRTSDIANWKVPYVSHEMGQWCVFPNFKEISKYSGPLKARNFELFQENLRDHNMGDQAQDFLMASGKLQALCYKTEIETALRTPNLAGFQLLALNDYSGQGTALVGMLDALWDEKGYMGAKEFSRFCNQAVPIARFPKFIYSDTDTLVADIEITNYAQKPLENAKSAWEITDRKNIVIASGTFDTKTIPIGSCFPVGKVSQVLSAFNKAAQYNLKVTIGNYTNDWDFWVYPSALPKVDTNGIYLCDSLDAKAEEVLVKGGKVFLCAAGKVENGKDIKQTFTPVFWNTSWFKMRPPHTIGILVKNDHPVFNDFPTEYHSNYQWWNLVQSQQVMNIDSFPPEFRPLVQPIDTWFLNRRLALLFEARVNNGKIMVCSADLKNSLDTRPAAKQLYYSIVNYMRTNKFNPQYSVAYSTVKELFEKKERKTFNSYSKDSPDELKPNKKP